MGARMDGTCDDEKLAELLLYMADCLADQPAAGSTKLNKMLFFAEFTHVREHGRPIPANSSRQEVRPAFYALLADEATVEIVDVVIDEDWIETLGDDFA